MLPIPPKISTQLEADPRMKYCVIQDEECDGRIEWHHVWIYAGRQINEIWAIVGACKFHHRKAEIPRYRDEFQRISLSLASEDELTKYPRKDWKQIKKFLCQRK